MCNLYVLGISENTFKYFKRNVYYYRIKAKEASGVNRNVWKGGEDIVVCHRLKTARWPRE